ncbi:MAG: hypothetical protein ABIF77_03470, partial [bacterium]
MTSLLTNPIPRLTFGSALLTCFLLTCSPALFSATAAATNSTTPPIGFSNPDDLESLLAYRLPTWGYRIWDLGFDLGGGGEDDDRQSARFGLGLDSSYELYGESEDRQWNLSGRI